VLKTGPAPRRDVDLHLAVAEALLPNNPTPWGPNEIADFVGCHHSLIQQIERAALSKMRLRLDHVLKAS